MEKRLRVGCLAGLVFYRKSCADVGLFEVGYPGPSSGGDKETVSPECPGGIIDGGGEPDGEPLSYD